MKWVKYYLDFCHKYQFEQGTDVSLSAFLKKLGQKRQPPYLQEQAEQAVQLLFSCSRPSELQPDFISKDKKLQVSEVLPNTNSNNRQENKVLEDPPRQAEAQPDGEKTIKIAGADWTNVFTELQNAIRVRHYSRATLKTYTSWVRKFQAFTQSKDPKLLTTDDVKNYLTSLAVQRNVAASTQNQAFNALLFFFRNVLGKEFGKVQGVVRAKRKFSPYTTAKEKKTGQFPYPIRCLPNSKHN